MVSQTAPIDPMDQLVFKGFKHGLRLILPRSGEFNSLYEELIERLEKSHDFFRGANVTVVTKGRTLTPDERGLLEGVFTQYGVMMQLDTDVEAVRVTEQREKLKEPPSKIIPKTIRSGQRIEFEGNVVIKGDINPGGEVIATGDIIVLGVLRGIAHAGAGGNESAEVIAFEFQPVQLRIAGLIARPPEKTERTNHPEVARVRNGAIEVEKYNDRY